MVKREKSVANAGAIDYNLPMIIFALLASIFWFWMLVDCAMNPRLTGTEKLVWVLIVLFTHFIGALLYYVLARSKRTV